MNHFDYILIGGGMSADAAARGIRSLDSTGSIALFSAEPYAPYNRPPLSKGLWKKTKLERIWRHTESLGAELFLETAVKAIHPAENQISDQTGRRFSYGKLLLATGATPIRLSPAAPGVIYYRELQDYFALREQTEQKESFIVIGGGYIGSEIAAALALNGKKVTLIFPEEAVCGRLFPADLAENLNKLYSRNGVNILASRKVTGISSAGIGFNVKTDRGEEIAADGVIAGLGVRPNTALAEAAGMQVEKGIRVNGQLQTSMANIYAAGDCIDFYNPLLGQVIRAEHEEHANRSGELAGRNMAGAETSYDFLPSAYSDLFDFGFEMVGKIDARLPFVADWQSPYEKGVLYTFEQQGLAGVITINLFGKMDAARQLLRDRKNIRPENVSGRIEI